MFKFAAEFTVSDKISVDGMTDIKQNTVKQVSKPTQTWRKKNFVRISKVSDNRVQKHRKWSKGIEI